MTRKCANCGWWDANFQKPEKEDGYYPCNNPQIGGETGGEDGKECAGFLGSDATEINVPQHTPNGIMELKNQNPIDGPVEILIVTYRKDFPWLRHALQCIAKHATGFSGVTIGIPEQDLDELIGMRIPYAYSQTRIKTYYEPAGKGFLNHEAMMATAEQLVPAGTQYVFHMDADCFMKMSNEPRDYFYNDKPIYIWRTWESLISPEPRDPTRKVVSDCDMWREPTARQVGFHSDAYTMCRHPTVFPIDFYPRYRDHIAGHHQIPFLQYMLSGERNTHPQDRLDFTAMGQYAHKFMHDRFHWINCATEPYPPDRMRAYWSHGGLTPAVMEELKGFLE